MIGEGKKRRGKERREIGKKRGEKEVNITIVKTCRREKCHFMITNH